MATAVPHQSVASQIERRHRPAYAEFVREFLNPLKPVVISGAFDGWGARQWTPETFRQTVPEHSVKIDGTEYRMADFIEAVVNSSDEHPAPYLRNAIIDRYMPELLKEIQPYPVYCSPNWLDGPLSQILQSRLHGGGAELYIGGRGGKFPFLHYDAWHTHTFMCQIYGTKEFTTYSPDQAMYLYARPEKPNVSQIPNLENPDYDRFPLFKRANPMRFVLSPGDMLFIPCGLWHTTKMLTPSISVSLSRANASNWSLLTRDMCKNAPLPLKPIAAAYLTGMRVFRTLYGS
jgi:histone arginine demethylase JMJD6